MDKDGLISYDEFVMLFRHANPDTTVRCMAGNFEFRIHDSATSGAGESLMLSILVLITLLLPQLVASTLLLCCVIPIHGTGPAFCQNLRFLRPALDRSVTCHRFYDLFPAQDRLMTKIYGEAVRMLPHGQYLITQDVFVEVAHLYGLDRCGKGEMGAGRWRTSYPCSSIGGSVALHFSQVMLGRGQRDKQQALVMVSTT